MKTYYTIYQITNLVNGKIYIGSHKTKNLDDSYMGSGKYLRHSINKHGVENFRKDILFVFDTPEEMYSKEAELVDVDFIAEENTYNLKVGGFGGFDYVNSDAFDNPTHAKKHLDDMRVKSNSVEHNKTRSHRMQKLVTSPGFITRKHKICYERHGVDVYKTFSGKQHTDDAKCKISSSNKGKRTGKDNSQYGTCWIHDITVEQNKKIKKVDLQAYLDKGWVAGRKMKF